jgi:3'-phosphoadenosine 5'-phosphosulfate sulfotransferase (PAPS reductase)/FAD synthetase
MKQEKLNFITDEEMEFYLFDLATRFTKINPKKYALAYLGGNDSHFLYWFIKEYLKDTEIEVVALNTYMEHPQILDRMKKNADKILRSKMKPREIKEIYGVPVVGKNKDEMIMRYQKGNRSKNTVNYIMGTGTYIDKNGVEQKSNFKLNKKARELLLNDKMPKVTNLCCEILKKKPMRDYLREVKKKSIVAVRRSESMLRKSKYNSCFTEEMKFTPIFDLTDEMLDKIQTHYNIEVPEIYNRVSQTGCMGCPYGCNSKRCNTLDELKTLHPNRQRWLVQHYKESYEANGINVVTLLKKLEQK